MFVRKNYEQESYTKEDFLRYINSVLSIYAEKNINSIEGLKLLKVIINNILTNLDDEKYQRLSTASFNKGKPNRVYQYFTSCETGIFIITMLGFRKIVHQMECKWYLTYKDRIAFYPDLMELIDENIELAEEMQMKPFVEHEKKVREEKERIERVKNKLRGDRNERKDINWVAKSKDRKPLFQ